MSSKFVRYILLSQLSLIGFLLVCLALIPHFLTESNEGGVSNYGLYAKTVVPYTLAFGLSGLFTLRAAEFIPKEVTAYKTLKRAFIGLGLLLIMVLVSTYPYKVNDTFNTVHIYAGTILALYEIILGAWFSVGLARDKTNISLFALQLMGFGLGLMTHFGIIHILFVTEMLMSLAFGPLAVRAATKLASSPQDTP